MIGRGLRIGAAGLCALIAPATLAGAPQSTPAASEIATVEVPSVRRDPISASWTLRYQRYRSTAATPGPPIVFLAGGPGDSGIRAVSGMPRALLDSLLAVADVVAFDQRGTGGSDPAGARCPPGKPRPLDQPFDPEAWTADLRARLAACLPVLALRGIRADAFTTEENADDVAALARAVGARRVALWAGSYGTHLALSVARRHPALVAGLALFGVEGPDDTLKRPSQVDAVLAEIDRHHPGLLARVRLAREGLRRQPWTKVLPNGASVTVGPWDLQRRIADALDTLPEIQALPTALEAMAAGDYSDLVAWAIPFRAPAPINVMHVSMDCASYASPERLEAIRREAAASLLGDAINAPMPGICTTPGLPRLTDEFRAPLRTDIRTLLVAGTFDGRTPPANLDALRGGFSRADVLVLPGASHSLFREPAALSAALRFLGELGID